MIRTSRNLGSSPGLSLDDSRRQFYPLRITRTADRDRQTHTHTHTQHKHCRRAHCTASTACTDCKKGTSTYSIHLSFAHAASQSASGIPQFVDLIDREAAGPIYLSDILGIAYTQVYHRYTTEADVRCMHCRNAHKHTRYS